MIPDIVKFASDNEMAIHSYLIAMNILGFMLMWIDKRRARLHKWRIPERTLLAIAVIGGSIGSIAGMYLFHHKTRHWAFVIGMPLILLLQMALAVCLTGGFQRWEN